MRSRLVTLVAAVLSVLVLAVAGRASAQLTTLTSGGGFIFDFQPDGDLSNGSIDAYDGCYFLTVGGARYTGGVATPSADGRTLTFPVQSMAGLSVSRQAFVPASGGDYARYLEILQNSTAAPITVDVMINGNLGSDTWTAITGSSSGDLAFSTADDWLTTNDPAVAPGDPALAHVIQGPGAPVRASAASLVSDNISWTFHVTVAAGARAVVLTFAVQKGGTDDTGAQADATSLDMLPDTATVGIDTYLPDVVNFLTSSPCAGADGSACTSTTGTAGTCHATRCCVGCWDGTRCHGPGTSTACGLGGGACTDCTDTDPCSLDTCTSATGVCAHPPAPTGTACNDGLFCTAVDQCDGADHCMGAGAPCDDGNPCTMETCIEATHMCSGHAPLPDGAACSGFPAGTCHAGLCCSGCWNGTSCQAGTVAMACGGAGGACASCVDGDACTNDVCTAGACSNPLSSTAVPCDDGLYCTRGDHCDGADHCTSGAASPCDDGSACTIDACDEPTDTCSHMTASGGCAIFGSCFTAGDVNPSNRCQVCDPTRSTMAWSVATGLACGSAVCAGSMITSAPTCDATGACVPGTRAPCPSGVCVSATMCAAACTMDSECGATGYCDMATGMCAPRTTPGSTCDRSAECAAGVCSTDHHCCATACAGACQSCNIPGNLGRCLPVPAGTDPDGECTAPDVCSAAGTCGVGPADAGAPDLGGGGMDLGAMPPVDAGGARDASSPSDLATSPDSGAVHSKAGCCGVAGARGDEGLAALAAVALAISVMRRRRRAC